MKVILIIKKNITKFGDVYSVRVCNWSAGRRNLSMLGFF